MIEISLLKTVSGIVCPGSNVHASACPTFRAHFCVENAGACITTIRFSARGQSYVLNPVNKTCRDALFRLSFAT
jgi:hypothetical protein